MIQEIELSGDNVAALSDAHVAGGGRVLACDIVLPPNELVRAGTPLSEVLVRMELCRIAGSYFYGSPPEPLQMERPS